MNKERFLFLLIIIFSFIPSSYLAARNSWDITSDSFEETAGTGLVIYTNPAGVRVFIDGIEQRRTPVVLNHLPQGIYHIRLTRDGYKDREFTVTLFDTSRLVVSIKMEEERGTALVSVNRSPESPGLLPLNPQLYANTLNEEIGISPSDDNIYLLDLPLGYNIIISRAFGWLDESVSVIVNETSQTEANLIMKPALFSIRNPHQTRRRFNPLNSSSLGVSEIRFEVSAPGTGTISVQDSNGSIVYINDLPVFETWHQHITWNGRDNSGEPLPEGKYTIIIEASALHQTDSEDTSIKLETEISYSINIFPLSLESGISGLTFAPMPVVLPSNSFQIDAGIFFGSFYPDGAENETLALPFLLNVRFALFSKLELAAAININSYLSNQEQTGFSGFGITGSAKFNFIDNNLLSFAAGISYTWAQESGELPISPGSGFSFYIPFVFKLSDFYFILSPSLLWDPGFIPSLHFSAGILYQRNSINTGLSARYELNDNTSDRFFAGAELHLFPPPSNLVFSFLGGAWIQAERTGGYGGVRVGIIY